jgi:hypothetical protein
MNLKTVWRLSCCALISLLILADHAFAGSIFSRRGIGLLRYRDNVRAIGMGGVGMAMGDSISFYFLNPAGLTRINLTRVQGDFRYERASVNLVRTDSNGLLSDANVNSFGLAIPIKYATVLALGVRPYSGTDFQFRQTANDSLYTESLSSVGGISELYLGYAMRLGRWRAGAIVDFYFGRINRI